MKLNIQAVVITAAIFLIIFLVMEKLKKFVSPLHPIRRRRGVGDFGAHRTAHPEIPHQGQDFFASVGQNAYAPISGTVRIAAPYPSDPRYSGVEITSASGMYKVKMFYLNPSVSTGDKVTAGDYVGEVQDLSLKYGQGFKDQNHVHIEIRRLGIVVDPSPYFANDSILSV